ncbi:glycosyltransferase family 2 protein [Salmonirosea aquatica]|uniref:Glycosyltransferase n=1 Tax=Salmonirosea aquatica TaxID=2654236 RepID=A0A7C9FX28_9BACT|nr:glycosyltransferase [Cytophagaceae bacterium SJW1-29]
MKQSVPTPAARFPEVTLLITHYNRSSSLARLLATFEELGTHFGEIVVSDDGSRPEHQQRLREIQPQYGFRWLATEKNRGLGNNLNKGQDAVKTAYTLYIQEDFIPNPEFVPALAEALRRMQQDPSLDMARFYAYFKYPYLKPVGDGFSEMQFSIRYPGYKKFYMYSDHPHLRRSTFFQRFGRYREDLRGDMPEYRMMISFLKNKGKAIYFERYRDLLTQSNSSVEPSTIKRNFLRESDNFLVATVRHFYRHIKMNWDYLAGR